MTNNYFLPVHIISISVDNFDPSVFKYSDCVTEGTARVLQYCVGHNKNFGHPKCWKISFVTETLKNIY